MLSYAPEILERHTAEQHQIGGHVVWGAEGGRDTLGWWVPPNHQMPILNQLVGTLPWIDT
jgi:hypothetical protein